MRTAIKVEQHKINNYIGQPDEYKYKVTWALNTTTPKVGEVLNEKELKELIDPCHVEVTIVPAECV